jgi:hypothetical protein
MAPVVFLATCVPFLGSAASLQSLSQPQLQGPVAEVISASQDLHSLLEPVLDVATELPAHVLGPALVIPPVQLHRVALGSVGRLPARGLP